MSDIVYWAEARGVHVARVLGVYRTEEEARARCELHAGDKREYRWKGDRFVGDGWHDYAICRAVCDGSGNETLGILRWKPTSIGPNGWPVSRAYVWTRGDDA